MATASTSTLRNTAAVQVCWLPPGTHRWMASTSGSQAKTAREAGTIAATSSVSRALSRKRAWVSRINPAMSGG